MKMLREAAEPKVHGRRHAVMTTASHSLPASSRALWAALLFAGWITSAAHGQLEFYSDIEHAMFDVGAGAAYTNEFSEGWIDGVLPFWSDRVAAAGLHARFAAGEHDRFDTAIGGILGYWIDRWETLASLSAYWEHHELGVGEFDGAVVGSEFYTPLGEFRIFGHFSEDWSRQSLRQSTSQIITNLQNGQLVQTRTDIERQLETIQDGFELEYGGDLPWWEGPGRARLFVGYQWWGDSPASIDGITARAQWVATKHLSLQARYFEDPLMIGGYSHWRFEIALRFPLGERATNRLVEPFTSGKKTVVTEPSPGLLRRPVRTTWPVRAQTTDRRITVQEQFIEREIR